MWCYSVAHCVHLPCDMSSPDVYETVRWSQLGREGGRLVPEGGRVVRREATRWMTVKSFEQVVVFDRFPNPRSQDCQGWSLSPHKIVWSDFHMSLSACWLEGLESSRHPREQ